MTAPKKTKKVAAEEIRLLSADAGVGKPRLKKLIIKNFRSIRGPVSIDLDDVVVLVGPNNCGKSSILKAYEIVMSHGSNGAKLTLQDFPNEQIDAKNTPEIELVTRIFHNEPGERWIREENGEKLITERWTWEEPGEPVRQGFDVQKNAWDDEVPWGAPNIANANRPMAHRIDAFENPESQVSELLKLLSSILADRVAASKQGAPGETGERYAKLLQDLEKVQIAILAEAEHEIQRVQAEVSKTLSSIFPGYKVSFEASSPAEVEKSLQLFKSGASLRMGPEGGYSASIEHQGSGAKRTLLWAILKFIEETNALKKGALIARPHLLLMDEPESCLHPSKIREACRVLYELPKQGNWQVMITTHSPFFIDLSRDNTTIIRVTKDEKGEVTSSTLFRPEVAALTDDDKKNLKLLNVFDSNVGEFFFGRKNIIVEGDTEYVALRYIAELERTNFPEVNVIRARGKATIVSLCKILNRFGAPYSVLHDTDHPLLPSGRKNSAWTLNQSIMNEVKQAPTVVSVRLVASIGNFESAFLASKTKSDKPYHALLALKANDDVYLSVRQLLAALVDHEAELPSGVVQWHTLNDLEAIFSAQKKGE